MDTVCKPGSLGLQAKRSYSLHMPVPDSTSAESFADYVGGKLLRVGEGKAWREVKAWTTSLPRVVSSLPLPSVSEPFLAWTYSGKVEFQEREGKQPWISHTLKKGSFFLTSGGAPYEVRWKAVAAEPFESMAIFLELPLLERALEEVFGADAAFAHLRDVSAFSDDTLNALMVQLHGELMRKKASPLFVQGIGQTIAVHLARNYTELVKRPRKGSPSLPGFKLRQITDWIKDHIADDFDLEQLATHAGLSKFHFHRLFRGAVGEAPARYHMSLRMNEAKRLLRETKKSVVDVAMDVGYSNPSHFAQIFRRETGLSPRDYRQQL